SHAPDDVHQLSLRLRGGVRFDDADFPSGQFGLRLAQHRFFSGNRGGYLAQPVEAALHYGDGVRRGDDGRGVVMAQSDQAHAEEQQPGAQEEQLLAVERADFETHGRFSRVVRIWKVSVPLPLPSEPANSELVKRGDASRILSSGAAWVASPEMRTASRVMLMELLQAGGAINFLHSCKTARAAGGWERNGSRRRGAARDAADRFLAAP